MRVRFFFNTSLFAYSFHRLSIASIRKPKVLIEMTIIEIAQSIFSSCEFGST